MNVNQIVKLVKSWSGVDVSAIKKDGTINKRHFSPETLHAGYVMGILDENYGFSNTDYPSLWDASILWEIIKDEVQNNTGISLAKSKVWRIFGLYEAGSRFHNEIMMKEMESILIKLDLFGYIYFNVTGSIWDISTK